MPSFLGFLEKIILHPHPLRITLWRQLMRRFPVASFSYRASIDAVIRPQYAHCILEAATLARDMGLGKFSIIEFGVASGAGLVCIERHVKEVEKEFGVACEVYGFDTGEGMPPSTEPRDMLYAWGTGFYRMDRAALEKRLQFAKLVIGNVKDTCEDFFARYKPAPIGCILFDLDYYTSTKAALQILEAGPETRLPRITCHLDDISHTNEFLGELCAIREFNETHDTIKIAPDYMFREMRRVPMKWNMEIFTVHDFAHPQYNQCYRGDRQMPLKP